MNLTITCQTNPELYGTWKREIVEKEMRELDMEVKHPNDWLIYILNHVFTLDEDRVPQVAYDALMSSAVTEITFKTASDDLVKVTKTP